MGGNETHKKLKGKRRKDRLAKMTTGKRNRVDMHDIMNLPLGKIKWDINIFEEDHRPTRSTAV